MTTVKLRFVNKDATPKVSLVEATTGCCPDIALWYGAFHAGDDYEVYIDGVKQKLGINGELISPPERRIKWPALTSQQQWALRLLAAGKTTDEEIRCRQVWYVSDVMARLTKRGLVRQTTKGRYELTPAGREQVAYKATVALCTSP